ncbi:MAG: hypothetical protein JST93_30510 [Acidobacteria bacterium]|nr:hypothetical protein [Acidobacteriota bacterium]
MEGIPESFCRNHLVMLPNGAKILIQLVPSNESVDADASAFEGLPENVSLDGLWNVVAGFAELAENAFKKVKPNKLGIEFGVDVTAEAGTLTALIVKGAGKATIKISMQWENS